MVATTREQIMSLATSITIRRHSEISMPRGPTLVQRYHLGVRADGANLFQYLANGLLYFDATLRAAGETIRRTTGSVRQLWRHGISGDYPIVL